MNFGKLLDNLMEGQALMIKRYDWPSDKSISYYSQQLIDRSDLSFYTPSYEELIATDWILVTML